MSNILKVTTSIGGYDHSNTVKQNPEMQKPATNIQGPVQPDKVVRPDARSDSAYQEQNNLQFQYETNLDNFLQQIKTAPVLTQELPKIFQEYRTLLVESGIGANYAEEIDKFLNMIQMDYGKLGNFVKVQGESAVRFTGAFFQMLRQIMNQTKSVELKTSILTFLKKYTDMSESDFVFQDIQRNINTIKERMFPKQREHLGELQQKLNSAQGGEQQGIEKLKLLKQEILPFVNRYISEIHERGVLRDATAQMAELISRYENGLPEGVQQSFERLMDYQIFQKMFPNFDATQILQVLKNTEFERASEKNREMEQLADILRKGAMGEAGAENKAVFREMIRSMVLNESVYMPLLHFMVPLCQNGKLMFSEIWIDPDAEKGAGGEDADRVIKGLIKFDIQDLGFFDLFFVYSNEKVNLQLNIPKELQANKENIQSSIRKIMMEHAIEPKEFVIGNSEVSIPITDAFENLKERKKTVNVSI